jgi:hypothetical protein
MPKTGEKMLQWHLDAIAAGRARAAAKVKPRTALLEAAKSYAKTPDPRKQVVDTLEGLICRYGLPFVMESLATMLTMDDK